MDRYKKQLDITSAPGKRQFSDVLLPLIQSLSDSVEKDHYLNALANTIEVSREALTNKMSDTAKPAKTLKSPKVSSQVLSAAAIEMVKTQDHFLCLVLLQPKIRSALNRTESSMFLRSQGRELHKILTEQPDVTIKNLPELVPNLQEYVKILVVQYEELYQGLEFTELQYEATRLQVRLIEQYVKNQKAQLRSQMPSADEATLQVLLGRDKQLNELLKGSTING